MKPLQPRQRLAALLLGAAALAALAALASTDPAREPVREPAPETAPDPIRPGASRGRGAPAQAAALADPGRAFRVQPLPELQDAFQSRNWQPAPPAPKPAPLAKPVAPPLPFAYLGRIEEDGATTVYLRRGDNVVLAQPHKAIDSTYLLEEAGADRLVFVYLPLQQQQVLSLGAR